MERRTIQDWVIRPLLKGLPDVVDVNSIGGFVKQYQVIVEPGLLRKYDLALHEVFDAVAKNNANAGGNILEKGSEKYIVRGVGPDQDDRRYREHRRRKKRAARRSTCGMSRRSRSVQPSGTGRRC